MSALRLLLPLLLLPCAASAHVGSPDVFFEGQAGAYPVQVVIRPAEVIPGLAEISVRVQGDGVQRVTALPVKWNTGRKGAPPPDEARLVPGETNWYRAQLWFMEEGAQSVEVEVTGTSGTGRVTIPVDAVARRVLAMPKVLGGVLAALGCALAALLVSIIGAAARQSVLEPGAEPSTRRRYTARAAMAAGAVILVLLCWGGRGWWNAESADYRHNRLYHPIAEAADVRLENGQRVLRLEITDPKFARASPFVPDHGKLMHLFLVREPNPDAFAHLHPVRRDRKTFEAVVPDLPAGTYSLYADVTYETGQSDTMTNRVAIGPSEKPAAMLDPDDSWWIAPAASLIGDRQPTASSLLSDAPQDRDGHAFPRSSPGGEGRPALRSAFDEGGKESVLSLSPFGSREGPNLSKCYIMNWIAPEQIVANRPLRLQFQVRAADRQAVALEPYLGMRGHLVVRKDDGSVFCHLHPGGTASMAAMQLAVLRAEGKLPLTAAFGADDPICQLPAPSPGEQTWSGSVGTDTAGVSFPYAFPSPGRYRLWVQLKLKDDVLTGVYDLEVLGSL